MSKIQEITLEPNIVYTGSFFNVKIKIVKKLTYVDLKKTTYSKLKMYTYNNSKGE